MKSQYLFLILSVLIVSVNAASYSWFTRKSEAAKLAEIERVQSSIRLETESTNAVAWGASFEEAARQWFPAPPPCIAWEYITLANALSEEYKKTFEPFGDYGLGKRCQRFASRFGGNNVASSSDMASVHEE